MSCNESIAGATLEHFAGLGATLEVLDVSMCVGFAGTLDALKHLRKLRKLYLHGCVDLEGSLEPLRNLRELALDVEACFGLQGEVHVLATLPRLRKLNISDTQVDAEGFVAAGACRVGRYENEKTPLWWAANCGQAHTARRLLEVTADRRGVEVDRAESSMTETRCWSRPHHKDLQRSPRSLFQHRADVNKVRNDGGTPLHFAAQVGSAEVAQVLLEHRVDVHKANKNMSTPLHTAARFGHVGIVRLLLENRAETTLKNQQGRTPLAIARRQGHEEVVAMLLVC